MHSRRAFLQWAGIAGTTSLLAACDKRSPSTTPRTVTLYTSVDAYVAQPVVAAYEKQSGTRVTLVTDTEATKTLGLVQRLVAERERPRCDVWWSGEALGTASLAAQGLLAPFTPDCITDFAGVWPAHVSDRENRWFGVATRARVTGFNAARIRREDVPTSPAQLLAADASLRIGIARPQFGTTRSHIAALVALHGEPATTAWLEQFAKRVRVYEGNSAVVQGIVNAEIDLGWTDTDDVWAGQANGWQVEAAFDSTDDLPMGGRGPIVMPCTVGIIRNAPQPAEAQRLASFLLSADAERLMSQTESRNVPVRPALAEELANSDPRLAFPPAAKLNWNAVFEAMPAADTLLARIFKV